MPAEDLVSFGGTFTNNCTGQSHTVQASFNLTEESSLLLFIDSISLKDNGSRLKEASSVVYSNMLTKPLEGGSLLFTLFNLTNFNGSTGLNSFTSSDHSGELEAHVLRVSNNVTLGYLDKFEVEIKGHDIIMGVAEKKAALRLEQGATYVQLITGDLKGVRRICIC